MKICIVDKDEIMALFVSAESIMKRVALTLCMSWRYQLNYAYAI